MVGDVERIRIGMVGSTVGNGHPYSWSAILNGYDRDLMTSECPFPGIPTYLNQREPRDFPHPHARVTHIFSAGDGGFTAEHVAACTQIDHVVDDPRDLIGEVDAVIVATDRGSEHVERCRMFVESGIPVLIDKPLVTNLEDLRTFADWERSGARIMSSSSMRFAREFAEFRRSTESLGLLRFVSATSPKSWETYGIHALEAVSPILGPGFETVQNVGTSERNIVHLTHADGVDVVVAVINDMLGGLACVQLSGTRGSAQVQFEDTYFSFRQQLDAFISYVRTGDAPFAFTETIELMKLVIAGIRSRESGGELIRIDELSV